MFRTFATAGALAAALISAGGAFGSTHAVECSVHGLSFGSVKVVGLHVSGVSCSAARRVAVAVARDVLNGRSISIAGAEGVGMSQASCTGCRTTTNVSISYPHGTVKVALRGGGNAMSFGTVPMPSFPAPGSSGSID